VNLKLRSVTPLGAQKRIILRKYAVDRCDVLVKAIVDFGYLMVIEVFVVRRWALHSVAKSSCI
jgi:hypothetical protein